MDYTLCNSFRLHKCGRCPCFDCWHEESLLASVVSSAKLTADVRSSSYNMDWVVWKMLNNFNCDGGKVSDNDLRLQRNWLNFWTCLFFIRPDLVNYLKVCSEWRWHRIIHHFISSNLNLSYISQMMKLHIVRHDFICRVDRQRKINYPCCVLHRFKIEMSVTHTG